MPVRVAAARPKGWEQSYEDGHKASLVSPLQESLLGAAAPTWEKAVVTRHEILTSCMAVVYFVLMIRRFVRESRLARERERECVNAIRIVSSMIDPSIAPERLHTVNAADPDDVEAYLGTGVAL